MFEESTQEVSQNTEGERAANSLYRRAEPAQSSLFWLDKFVLVVAGRRGMRGAEAHCKPATNTANKHAIRNGCIGETFHGRA